MQETINNAKAEFVRAKDRVVKALDTTPDDKINWSPSVTSRTPVEQVAHCALSIGGMQRWLAGQPFPFSSMAELDETSRREEAKYKGRGEVLAMLDKESMGYLAWLDAMTPDSLNSTLETAFGNFPMAVAITFPADHLRAHASQMEYIQTIYGDREWH